MNSGRFIAIASIVLCVVAAQMSSGETRPPIAGTTPSTTVNATPTVALAARPSLEDRVRVAIRDAKLGKGLVSISIRACDDGPDGLGRSLVSINADRPMIPASNMKLVSTGTALHVLGPKFQFRTQMVADGDTFTLVGDGDPTLGDPAMFDRLVMKQPDGERRTLDEEVLLGLWADAIVAASDGGQVSIRVDDSVFDRTLWHPGWNPNDRLSRFAAEISGLNFHRNTFHFRPDATGSGRPNWSDMRPNAPWLLANASNKSNRGKKQTAWIARAPEDNQLSFRGTVKGRFTEPLEVTFHDPAMILARLLADRVEARGVRVRDIGRTKAAAGGRGQSLGPKIRTPIGPVVERCNEFSQNLYAESLLKRAVHARTGNPGSWEEADPVVKSVARTRLGPDGVGLVAPLVIEDGSGLSKGNRLTADFLTAWLDSFHDDPRLRDEYIRSLSRGGLENDGTLSRRFRDLPDGYEVDAKSGYVAGVSTLSGFVTSPDGRRWAFSVLCNNVAHNIGGAKKLQERIAREIALADLAR